VDEDLVTMRDNPEDSAGALDAVLSRLP